MNPAFFVRRSDIPARPTSLIVVDQGIRDWPHLISLLPASMQASVLTLDGGLDQLAARLAHWPAGSLRSLHLLCHGCSGGLLLGGQWLTLDTLATHAGQLRQLGRALAADADWRVYGCEVAQGARGQRFVAALAALSGARLAAASTPIGLGHGWALDVQVGQPGKPAPAWLANVASQYRGVLAASHDFDNSTNTGQNTAVATATTWGWTDPITAIRLTAANGTWRMINDYGYYGPGSSPFSGDWAINSPTSAGSTITLTADINNDGVFGDTFWLKGLKLADPSNTGGIYIIQPNGASSGQELVEVSSSFTSLSSYTPGVTASFYRVTSVVINFASSATGIALDDIDIAGPGNTAPVITSGASASIAENTATSTVVYTLTATDADSDTVSYSLAGTDAAAFSIDTSGAVRLISPADFETQSSYSLTVKAMDAYATTTQAVTLSITDVNEAPTHISLSASSVAENTSTASALTIGTLSSTDPDSSNTFTYSIVGGADQASFQVAGANLQFRAGTTLDYETQSSYAVTVRSTDQGWLTYDKTLTISLSNVNEKPALTAPATHTVTASSATAITGISMADPDAGSGLLTLSLAAEPGVFTASNGGGVTVSGSGSPSVTLTGSQTDLNAFIAAGLLRYTTPAGVAGPLNMNVDSADGGQSGAGGPRTDARTVSLHVTPNTAPVITSGNTGSVQENAATSTVVYTAAATDADNDTLTYALSGTDAASFSIDATSGQVRLLSPADYESKSSYSIAVNARDAVNTTTKGVTLHVTDVDETPATPATPSPPATPSLPSTPATPTAPAEPEPATPAQPPRLLIDGVAVSTGTVTRLDGSLISALFIPVIPDDRQDQDRSSTGADIPLASRNGQTLLKAEIPTGIGMTVEDSGQATPGLADLANAIENHTLAGSADQHHMVTLGQAFLDALPRTLDVWVRTAIISQASDGSGQLVFRGTADDATQRNALVLDASHQPGGSVTRLEHIDFAAIIGAVTVTTGDGNPLLVADSHAQTFNLGVGNDTVHAGGGDDVLDSAGGNDRLFGQDGNDTLSSKRGQSLLHGGAGADTARFTGKADEYVIEQHHGFVRVISKTDPAHSTLVVNSETLQFGDSLIDVQNPPALNALAGLYRQVLGRQADMYGFDYFGGLQDQGYSLGSIALNMITTAEGQARGWVLTGNPVNDVEVLYKALLGRESDAAGKAAWVQAIQSGAMTLAQAADAFMQSPEMKTHDIGPTGWDFLV